MATNKKMKYPVTFTTKKILRFLGFISKKDHNKNRNVALKQLWKHSVNIAKCKRGTDKNHLQYLITFPNKLHQYYHRGTAAGFTEPLDYRVNQYL